MAREELLLIPVYSSNALIAWEIIDRPLLQPPRHPFVMGHSLYAESSNNNHAIATELHFGHSS